MNEQQLQTSEEVAETTDSSPVADPQRPSSFQNQLWREWVRPFMIILLLVGCFRSAVADWNDVPTGSMIPTILEGDRIFVNKAAYSLRLPFSPWHLMRWDLPQRGDIVVFFSPEDGKRLVKRVIGTPGDVIELQHNRLYINGEAVDYTMWDVDNEDLLELQRRRGTQFRIEELDGHEHPITLSNSNYQPLDMRNWSFRFEVPEDHFFMMGDNRHNSRDSRWFGAVHRDLIVGQATAVAFSLDLDDGYSPRWDRSLKKLE